MKFIFSFLTAFVFCFSNVFAQQPISIVTGDMPVAGDIFYNAIDNLPSGINPGPKGANQMWNFSSLSPDKRDTIRWMLPSATPYGSTFNSNSNLAITNNDTNYLFFNNSASVFKTTGAALWFDTVGAVVVTTFTGTNDLYRFPTTYNGKFSGTYSFTQDVTINGNQVRIEFTSNYTDTIDAWGIVQTPYGYYEALRQKRVDRTRTVVKAVPPLWITVSDTRDTTIDYNFLSKESKQALVDFAYDTLGNVSTIAYSSRLPKPIARFTYSGTGGNYTFTNTTYNTNGTTYVWDFGDGSPTNNATNPTHTYAANGQYNVCVTATNAQGSNTYCQTISVTGACPTILPNITTTTSACGQSTGSATAAPSGGANPYSFAWNNSQTTATINNLAAGSYTVTITDANSCTVVATANISNAGAPTITLDNVNDVSCYGGSDGAIFISVSGSGPFNYTWSNNATTDDAVFLLEAGTYTVTVEDNNNCAAVFSVTVTQPDSLNLSVIITDASSSVANDGSINLTVTGGVSPYTFAWSNSETTEDISALACGNYAVVVTDNNTCVKAAAYTVDCPVSVADFSNTSSVNVYPNPSTGKIFIEHDDNAVLKTEVYNALGENILNRELPSSGWLDLSAHAKGIYFVRINIGQQVVLKKILIE